MAHLKDLIINGVSRFIGDIFVNKIQVNSISIPSTSNSTTYTTGVNEQIIKTNGTSVYWGSDYPRTGTVSLPANGWGNAGSLDDGTSVFYQQITVQVNSGNITQYSSISLCPDSSQFGTLWDRGIKAILIENNTTASTVSVTAYCYGTYPSALMQIPCLITETQ